MLQFKQELYCQLYISNLKENKGTFSQINDLKEILKPQKTIVRGNIGKVAVIGVGIKNNKGMFQKVYNTLMSNDINVEMTSCSEINISCYIDRDDVKKAQVLLHEAFLG